VARQHSVALAAVLALAALFAGSTGRASAQALQRLTVEAFDLSADTAQPRVDVAFHLIVRLHVREPVTAISNLELPILAQLELLGDERSVETNSAGTEYHETITVVAHRTGTLMIGPATLQAIDARNGHAEEFYTNGLTLEVAGETLQPLVQTESAAVRALAWSARAALWIGGIACVGAVITLIFLRRPPPVVSAPAIPPPAPEPASPSPHDRLRDALTVLRAQRSRAAAVAVRAAVWQLMGASEGETLADVLRRPAATDPRVAAVLRSLERAAFTYDDDLDAAVAAACTALEELQ